MALAHLIDPPVLMLNPHGLVPCGNIVEDTDGRWENGVTFTPDGCFNINFKADDNTVLRPWSCPPVDKSNAQECVPAVTFHPYLLEMSFLWSTSDRGYDIKAKAIEMMELGTSAKLEEAITTPVVGNVPSLSDLGGATVLTTAPARSAIGNLENTLLGAWGAQPHIGGAGTIYINPIHAAQMTAINYFTEVNGCYYTPTGCKVIIGNVAPNAMYAHIGDVDVYLGDIMVNEFPDQTRLTNEVLVQVERAAMACWNPCAVFMCQVFDETHSSGAGASVDEVSVAGTAPTDPNNELWVQTP